MMDRTEATSFFSSLILRAGMVVDTARINFFLAWYPWEGSNAKFNPLATTMPGGEDPADPNFNSVGVRNYASFQNGVTATLDTLRQSNFTPLWNSIINESVQPGLADNLRLWGTTGFANAIEGGLNPFTGETGAPPPPSSPPPATTVPPIHVTIEIPAIEYRATNAKLAAAFAEIGRLFDDLTALIPEPNGG